ncbi:MAG TPA: alpha/beta fold hydrolase [Acidisarcina sp.]
MPLVSGMWLLQWFVISLASAGVLGYLSLCFLFYQGQWQLLFHPSRSITTTPASLGVPFEDVRFDTAADGVAQLDGWWIPGDPASLSAGRNAVTLLFLHDGRGSLSDAAPQLKALHSLGVNLFAFDYRGFGLSASMHPSEKSVQEDAAAAVAYLAQRHRDRDALVLYGVGLGATIAAETYKDESARRHMIAGLVLDEPQPPALTIVGRDPRARLLPLKILMHDRFDLARQLEGDSIPTLFFQRPGEGLGDSYSAVPAGMRMLYEVKGPVPAYVDPGYLAEMRRFLERGDAMTR